MRTSILSRSVVAVATLAIGSVALAAAPANAASNGVTRDQVLTAVNGVRAAVAANPSNPNYSAATSRALRAVINKTCDVLPAEDESAELESARPLTAGDDADGLLITAEVNRPFASSYCTFVAVATTADSSALSGTVSVTDANATPALAQSSALSGEVFTTVPLNVNDTFSQAATATGNATRTTKMTTSTKVTDKKSKAEKKAAKAKYDKRVKSAKKSYAKALDKAGSSKSKKAAAKKAYKAKRATAKTKFKYGIAGYKIVKKTTTVTDVKAFSITTTPIEL